MAKQANQDEIALWNRSGRDHITHINHLIEEMREGRDTPEEWPDDDRDAGLAARIIAAVEAAGRAEDWHEEAPLADRAHEPLIPFFDGRAQNLRCVTILGPDEFLLCPGSAMEPRATLHLKDGIVTERPDILAVGSTCSHDLFVVATADAFTVSAALDAAPLYRYGWPDDVPPGALAQLDAAEDGRTLLFTVEDEWVWLGQWTDEGVLWTRAYPDDAMVELIAEEMSEEEWGEEEEVEWTDSMMHAALSPDGRFIAYGSQCYGHFIDRIDGTGQVRRWAQIGFRSEYPHNACFSSDSDFAALNSCHFYHGATLAVRLEAVEGAVTPEYEESPLVTEIDAELRVYASTWLPQAAGLGAGGFALAGAGDLVVTTPDGTLLTSFHFGSSASSIDYCPKTGQLAVGSYSGFLHIYDPARGAEQGRTIGYRPLHERYRWVIWQDRAPFRW